MQSLGGAGAAGATVNSKPSSLADATIINWHDPDVNTDIAVSFQEQNGCDYIWCGGGKRDRDRCRS